MLLQNFVKAGIYKVYSKKEDPLGNKKLSKFLFSY